MAERPDGQRPATPRPRYTTRHGRQVHFTSKMQQYMQELQEEINRTEQEISRREQELRQRPVSQSTVGAAASARDNDRTAVKQPVPAPVVLDRGTGQPLFSSTPAATTREETLSRDTRSWPSALSAQATPFQPERWPPRHSYQNYGHESRLNQHAPVYDYVPENIDIRQAVYTTPDQLPASDRRDPVYQSGLQADTYTLSSDGGQAAGHTYSRYQATPSQGDDTTQILHKLADLLSNKRDNLPKMEPEVFTGDLFQFSTWSKSFEAIIERHTDSPAERLYFLSKYTAGAARQSIEGFFNLNSEDAYTRAKYTLMSRFGDRYKISEAFKGKLNDWPTIRPGDADGLRKFSDFLQHCNSAMASITYLESLNSAEENKKLIAKLPRYVADRWNRVIDRWLYPESEPGTYPLFSTGSYPPFRTFCQFMENESRIACGPGNVFNTTAKKDWQIQSKQPPKMDVKKKAQAGSFVSQASTPANGKTPDKDKAKTPQPCLLCKGPHNIDKCETFLKKSEQDKKAFVLSHGLCFGCLRRGHMYSDCRRKNPALMRNGATDAIPTDDSEKSADKPAKKPVAQKPTEDKKQDRHHVASSHRVMTNDAMRANGSLHSMILPVVISHTNSPDEQVMTYALLDTMSDTCFIKTDLVQQLKAESLRADLEITTLTSKKIINTEVVRGLLIRGVNEQTAVPLPKTYGRDDIPVSRSLIPKPENVKRWPHLQDVAQQMPAYYEDLDVGLLIGANCSAAMLPKKVVAGDDHEPYAQKTTIGWGVIGWMTPEDDVSSPDNRTHFVHKTSVREVTPREVHRMFDMDFSERPSTTKMSVQDTAFLKTMEEGIHRRPDGHIELPLPLKEDNLSLPNNRSMALQRLQGLKRRMMSNEKYRDDYTAFMTDMLEKGYAEKVPEDEEEPKGRVWYIPHHGVYHPRKPNKIRVVFDCSAEFKNNMLNEHLLPGPDVVNSLTGILLRFREEAVAVTCDIEAMFLQVGVSKEDRDLLRFVWWQDGDMTQPPGNYRMNVHLFGATSSPGCANYALKYAAATGDTTDDRAREFIQRNFYVDDGLASVPSPEEALQLIDNSRALCRDGGFNLIKFISNSKEVDEKLPVEIRAKNIQNINFNADSLPIEHALGVQWCVESDTLQFRVVLQDKPATRRGLLSTVSSVFDPLGLIAPVVLTGKKLLQELCKENAEWDDPLPDGIRDKWECWRTDLLNLATMKIPRCYKTTELGIIKKVELHHFSDACQTGYGQCSYLRLIDKDELVACTLVQAKSRVAPVKPITIPRLELTAAVTSVKISTVLDQELTYENITHVFWTDSTVVLGYIANEARRFHIFVANRVQQIRNSSSVDQWNHVSTKDNPADIASRGATATQLMNNTTWWHGPDFLSVPEPFPHTTVDPVLSEEDPEVKKVTPCSTHTTSVTDPDNQNDCDLLQRLKYFSSWYHAKRAVAVCIKYVKILKERVANRATHARKVVKGNYIVVTVAEIQNAEKLILRTLQRQEFPEEFESLSKATERRSRESTRTKRRSPLHRLDPYMGSDKLLRIGGRIRRANVPREIAHPVIVPKQGHITTLIIRQFHERTRHSGRQTTLNEIRASGFWIVKSRTAVTSYVWKCVTCKKLRGAAVTQKMSDLPPDRLDPAPPFTNSGVDLFGPFYVKEGRSEKKRWGCLFTCLTTRAIHIEVVHSLSTDSFLHAYRRFVGRRGPVRLIRCDQGTNFVGAMNEINHEKIHHTMSKDGCDWVRFKLNVPTASHMGGVWERMVRSARTVLSAILDQHSHQLDDETLHTFMVEVEAIVNSRPLTYVDTADPTETLSPIQLLTMKSKVVLPLPGVFVKEDMFCRKRWRRVQYLANQFWTRWRKEYLPTLQERAKWTKPENNLQQGDIVLMMSENVPRGQWPKGVVVDTYPSADDCVRKVAVKTTSGTYDRPIHKLILLMRPGIPAEEP